MPEAALQRILQWAGPIVPVEQPRPSDWQELERDLGLVLPGDYKALINSLGSGYFGVGLVLQNPNAASEGACFSANSLKRYREVVHPLESRMSISLFPKPGGLVLVGAIDRNHFLLSPKKGRSELTELFHLDHDLEILGRIGHSVVQFIHDLYSGTPQQQWAKDLKSYIWRDNTVPFFTARPSATSSAKVKLPRVIH